MKKRLVILLFAFLVPLTTLKAYDFKKANRGKMLFYSVLTDSTVAVVAPEGRAGGWGDNEQPDGRLDIPGVVVRDGQKYSVVEVAENTFLECDRLEAVTIPATVNTLGNNAFGRCGSLKTVVFNCDSLGTAFNSFAGCDAIDSIVLSASVRKMPPFVFAEMRRIGNVVLRCEHPEVMTNLFFGCQASAKLVVGSSVKRIPSFLFYNFTGLETVEFEDVIPSLTTIGECAFVNCTGLDEITIPASVRSIESGAFAHCTPSTLSFLPQRSPSVSGNAFFGVDKTLTVLIPCASLVSYANSAVGRYFENMAYSGLCDDSVERMKIIYIHDTVVVHDTVFVSGFGSVQSDTATVEVQTEETPDGDEVEIEDEEDEPWIFIDGKTVRIAKAIEMRGVGIRVFDEKGRMIVDDRIPVDQPVDNYYVKLPKRQRYFIRFNMGTPILIDVEKQEIH
jgi:hypothetical protein